MRHAILTKRESVLQDLGLMKMVSVFHRENVQMDMVGLIMMKPVLAIRSGISKRVPVVT
jgi:hypothetical protein